MTYSAAEVFTDWLSVSFSPEEDKILLDIEDYVSCNDGSLRHADGVSRIFEFGDGTIKLESRSAFLSVSASGGALSHMRANNLFHQYLGVISDYPHKVTRLDAALDTPVDTPKVLKSFRRKFKDGLCLLSRRPVPVTYLTSIRPDGAESGTFYAGHRTKARVTARVYDKALERMVRAGVEIPPTTRYELTFKAEVGASLYDVVSPGSLFFRYASPVLLRRPANTPDWVCRTGEPWSYTRMELTPAERLKRRVENSADLEAIIELADKVGVNGRTYLMSLLKRRVTPDRDHGSL